MAESKYCDVLLNLRNTGVNAMKSYYANSFNSSPFEKHRPEHTQHFKAPFDKYSHGISCIQSSPKTRKYECSSYQPLDTRKPRCDSSPFTNDTMVSYRHSENKLNSEYIVGGSSLPDRARQISDVHSVSSHTNKLSQYRSNKIPTFDNNNNPYLKRAYQSISAHDSSSDHVDIKPRPVTQPRFKYTPFRNDEANYNTAHVFYSQKGEMEKPYTNNHHTKYEQYRSLPTPCTLPCCATFSYDVKPVESRNYYVRREPSPPVYSPAISSNLKKTDYPDHAQGLSSREPGESSAFSPIRPSHIRRVHSTESGYSSESNATCHSANSGKELELCNKPKCCSMLNLNSPPIGHKVCRDIGNQINTSEHQKHMPNEHREHLTNEHERGHLTNEHRQHIVNNLARYQNSHPEYDVENPRVPMTEYHLNEHDHKGCVNRDVHEKMNNEHRERRMSGSRYHENINKDVWREHVNNDKYREYFNVENLRRAHAHSTDEDTRRYINSEGKLWKPVTEFNRCNDTRSSVTQPNDNKLEVCDEASRAAMKAFDAHIRKMIANSRDNNSFDYSTKFHHSINQSNHSFNLSIEGRHSFNQSGEYNDPTKQSFKDKHNVSQLNDKHSIIQSNDRKQSLDQSNEEKKCLPNNGRDTSVRSKNNEPSNEKLPSDQSGEDNTPANQSCDSTQKSETDETSEGCVKDLEKHPIEREKKEVSVITKDKEDPHPPQPELQCPAVDSTLNDDVSPPREAGVGGLLGLTRVANEHLGQALAKEKKRSKNNNCLHLWQFLRRMLDQEQDKVGRCIEWTKRETGEFRLIKTAVIADLWGQSKNRTCMTYEKMARAMRYYYKMNILEKVPHKRLHFRFGERILSKVLHPSNTKPFIGKSKVYEEMYNASKRNMDANYPPNTILKSNSNMVSDFRKGHNLNYLSMQTERGKNTIPYLPADIPGVILPPYYNEHSNNHLHHNLPHIVTNRMSEIPPPPREFTQKRIEPDVLPCNMPRKIVPTAVTNTSPGSNPSVSPYSGEETPETWSDVDSNDELVVDTDSE